MVGEFGEAHRVRNYCVWLFDCVDAAFAVQLNGEVECLIRQTLTRRCRLLLRLAFRLHPRPLADSC